MFSYICSVCGNIHVAEEPPQECPRCGGSSDKYKLKDSPEQGVWNGYAFGGARGINAEALGWDEYEEGQPLFEGDLLVIGDLLDQLDMFFQFLKDAQTSALQMTADLVSTRPQANPEDPLHAFD